jgi:hypothetical protein
MVKAKKSAVLPGAALQRQANSTPVTDQYAAPIALPLLKQVTVCPSSGLFTP